MPEQSALNEVESDPVVVPIILSGGSGTRLWPLSRKAFPKQLHALFGSETMLQSTLARVEHLEPPIIVCNNDQRFMVAEQARASLQERFDAATIVLEPLAKNTAAAIASAAVIAKQRYGDAILVVLAADHSIRKIERFHDSLTPAIEIAKNHGIAIFGVEPSRPETGYGYIEVEKSATDSKPSAIKVDSFKEKPSRSGAEQYVASGHHYWNSGMFVLRATKVHAEILDFNPSMAELIEGSVLQGKHDLDFFRLAEDTFAKLPSVSFDVAVMEQTKDAWMIPLQSDWSDVGSWDAVHSVGSKDERGNVVDGDCFLQNTQSSLVLSKGDRLVSVSGLADVVVVDTDDAVMVSSKSAAQDVKSIVQWIEQTGRHEYLHHRKQHRPWGFFDEICVKPRYRVREVHLNPGQSISSQIHRERSEHWVVVQGQATIERNGEPIVVSHDESVFIGAGLQHKVSNLGDTPLIMIEVSSGSRINEQDIERDQHHS